MEASCENGDRGPAHQDDGDEDGNDLDDLPTNPEITVSGQKQ